MLWSKKLSPGEKRREHFLRFAQMSSATAESPAAAAESPLLSDEETIEAVRQQHERDLTALKSSYASRLEGFAGEVLEGYLGAKAPPFSKSPHANDRLPRQACRKKQANKWENDAQSSN